MKLIKANIETAELPAFNQVVTSPPYYKQRRYSDEPGELGQEKTPVEFISRLAGIFLSLAGRMSEDGTMFINIGDKYQNGVLLGIPWRLAFALTDGGLILKNEIIWHKRRIMPQSAKNRFTQAHETVFMFTKKPKGFTFNYRDVMEDALWKNDRRAGKGPVKYAETREKNNNGHTCPVVIRDKRLCRNVWDFTTRKEGRRHSATYPYGLAERCVLAGSNVGDTVLDPFAGTCTTGYAAEDNGRNFVGVDITDESFPKGENDGI